MASSELDRQLELILRGTVEVIQLDELKAKLSGISERTAAAED